MSKLDELIKEYCPNGVEYRTIKDIAVDIYRGSGIKRDEITEVGIPCVRYGEIYTTYGIWFDSCVSHTSLEKVSSPKYFEYGDILFVITGESVDDIAKSTAYIGHDKCLAGGDIVVLKHEQNPKYLSYALSTTGARKQKSTGKVKSKVVHASVPSIEQIEIPVPPLPVQQEIVRILDNFTELQAELAAELAARKKQYEYYRDSLLNFSSSQIVNVERERERTVRWLRLSDISVLFRGEYITKKNTAHGIYPVILGGQEPAYYIDRFNHTGKIITVARSGASAGFVSCWDEPIFVTDGFGIEAKEEVVDFKFLYYTLKNKEVMLNAMKRGAGVPHISGDALFEISLPIPPLLEQKHIVSIIEHFDALCTDITSGLPAEISARQRQYEYYRDKLLSFPKTSTG